MKKVILTLATVAFLLSLPLFSTFPFRPLKANAQEDLDCRKTFDRESYQCLQNFNVCQEACFKEAEKPDGTTYFNSGEIYPKCMKERGCHEKSSACSEQSVLKYRSCLKPDEQGSPTEAKKDTPKQNSLPVFINEWFSRFSQVAGALKALPEVFTDVVYEDKFHLAPDLPKLSELTLEEMFQGHWYPDEEEPERAPAITNEYEQRAWAFLPSYRSSNEIDVAVVEGQGELKNPGSPQFFPVTSSPSDKPLMITFLDSTVRSTSDTAQLRYSWTDYSGAVINLPKSSEIKFLKPVQDEKTKELKRMLKLNKGEVEIKVKNSNAKDKFGVQGDFFDLFVVQTHFWINQSIDKKLAVIGVYDGEVGVEMSDGKTIKIKPDGDKPGVIVVTKNLSFPRLAVVVAITATMAGSVVWFIKKKSKRA